MNISALIGTKLDQKQAFLEDGSRIPVSLISIRENVITQIKTSEKDGYAALQMGFGTHKKAAKPVSGIAKKAGLQDTPRFFREVRVEDTTDTVVGTAVKVEEIFEPGDVVKVTGTSKGKGFAGVVKRHGFHGGPKTHGQSDRHRAPGAIGQGTTPGRVYKGKRMAGHMGAETATVRNLVVMDIVDGILFVKGLVPGPKGTLIEVTKIGKDKKFMPLFKKVDETAVLEDREQMTEVVETAPVTEEVAIETVNEDVVAETPAEETEEKIEIKEEEAK